MVHSSNKKKHGKGYVTAIGILFIIIYIVLKFTGAGGETGISIDNIDISELVSSISEINNTLTEYAGEATEIIDITTQTESYSIEDIPEYSGKAYVEIDGNVPRFNKDETLCRESYEEYSELDSLGRCGVCTACIGTDLMPTESRGDISSVKPSGWKNKPYDFIDGGYLYNRCHLIGFQLTAENDNERNLITGTRYMNVDGMLPFENKVADYLEQNPDNHVLYRVTPVFEGNNLVASGVLMEAWSIEDGGNDICFFVYCYNVQPGVIIDYATGASEAEN